MAGLLAAFMLNVSFAKKTPVALVIVLLLSIPLTGCVNDESDLGEITTVSMTIYHGYSIDNATSNHTIEIELYSGIAQVTSIVLSNMLPLECTIIQQFTE